MGYMTEKFKGVYRLKTPYDNSSFQFPRDLKGNFSDYDVYIDCANDIKVSHFGHAILEAYIPSLGRGHNIIRAIYTDIAGGDLTPYTSHSNFKGKDGTTTQINCYDYEELYKDSKLNNIIFDIREYEIEIMFKFNIKYMEQFEKYFKPKTGGASISPFSVKNLPKSDYNIPDDDMEKYKSISSKMPKEGYIILGQITRNYIKSLGKTKKAAQAVKDDMRLKRLKGKKYIHSIEKWDDYLKYMDKEIDKYLKEKLK